MPSPGAGDGIFRHRGLIALTVGLSALECGILVLVGPHASRGLAPQVTAPSPFGAFHDLRWLLVYHRSWITLGFELAALLAFRGALDALLRSEERRVGKECGSRRSRGD